MLYNSTYIHQDLLAFFLLPNELDSDELLVVPCINNVIYSVEENQNNKLRDKTCINRKKCWYKNLVWSDDLKIHKSFGYIPLVAYTEN